MLSTTRYQALQQFFFVSKWDLQVNLCFCRLLAVKLNWKPFSHMEKQDLNTNVTSRSQKPTARRSHSHFVARLLQMIIVWGLHLRYNVRFATHSSIHTAVVISFLTIQTREPLSLFSIDTNLLFCGKIQTYPEWTASERVKRKINWNWYCKTSIYCYSVPRMKHYACHS